MLSEVTARAEVKPIIQHQTNLPALIRFFHDLLQALIRKQQHMRDYFNFLSIF